MAEVAAKSAGFQFTLVLSEAEAQYVEAALFRTEPTRLDKIDPVWTALDEAMLDAGVSKDRDASRSV